jgi:hypothetical protein
VKDESMRGASLYLLLGAPLVFLAQACGIDPTLSSGDGGVVADGSGPDGGCLGGATACNGTCCHMSQPVCGASGCCATINAGHCQSMGDCCASTVCTAVGVCAMQCNGAGGACGGDTDCCWQTFCGDGGCLACLPRGDACTSDTQCCTGSCGSGADGGRVCVDG